jgi:hypothetical protein
MIATFARRSTRHAGDLTSHGGATGRFQYDNRCSCGKKFPRFLDGASLGDLDDAYHEHLEEVGL